MTRFRALWSLRCPRCLHGAVFDGVVKLRRHCPDCQLEYEREPGYFLGAMYFSYGMALVITCPLAVILMVSGVSWNMTIFSIFSVLVLLSPLLVRYSRILWLYFDQFWEPR